MKASEIHIRDYDYVLPEERIAKFPLAQRDASKLLIYDKGNISHTLFRNIVDYIPAADLLVSFAVRRAPPRSGLTREC